MKFVEIFGYKVYSDHLSKIPISDGPAKVINCSISPNSYGLALKDKEFDRVLKSTDYLMLDGVYFALASILLKGKNIKANQGPDVFDFFIKKLNKTGGKAFFLGSTENTLKKIKERANIEYPGIDVSYYSPPFKPRFSDEDNMVMIQKINDFQPDIVFVGMTCPKQEKWAVDNREKLKTGLVISIGNVFDWYAKTQKSIPKIWFRLRLGWLIRIFLRPEIFKRNIGNQMVFFRDLMLFFLKIKKYED